jgi:hypothetical protein
MTVGFKDVTIAVANQTAHLGASAGLRAECAELFYGDEGALQRPLCLRCMFLWGMGVDRASTGCLCSTITVCLAGTLCAPCPERGADCFGGGINAVSSVGYWMVASQNSSSRDFVACMPAFACLGNNTCLMGYVGSQVRAQPSLTP